MKKMLIPGQYVQVTVRSLPSDKGPGKVQASNGDVAWFLFPDSHDVVVGEKFPEFGPGRASLVRVGDEIVGFVEKRGNIWAMVDWTHAADLAKARECPKSPAAPVVEQVAPQATTSTAKKRRRCPTIASAKAA